MINKKSVAEQTGLTDVKLQKIRNALSQFSEIQRVCIFGSRAKGTYKPGSDIDITFFGDKISSNTLREVIYQLNEETTMPYFFDIVHYESINNEVKILRLFLTRKCTFQGK